MLRNLFNWEKLMQIVSEPLQFAIVLGRYFRRAATEINSKFPDINSVILCSSSRNTTQYGINLRCPTMLCFHLISCRFMPKTILISCFSDTMVRLSAKPFSMIQQFRSDQISPEKILKLMGVQVLKK